MVADGNKIKVGKCHKVKLQIQDYNLESPFYTVPLGGVDVVLSVQWLQTLNTNSANHQKQFIKFRWEGQIYKLYGFQPPQNQILSSHQMVKLIRKGAPTYIVQCHRMEMLALKLINEVLLEDQELIQKHKKVFQNLPLQMPLERTYGKLHQYYCIYSNLRQQ